MQQVAAIFFFFSLHHASTRKESPYFFLLPPDGASSSPLSLTQAPEKQSSSSSFPPPWAPPSLPYLSLLLHQNGVPRSVIRTEFIHLFPFPWTQQGFGRDHCCCFSAVTGVMIIATAIEASPISNNASLLSCDIMSSSPPF